MTLDGSTQLHATSAIYHLKLRPSTDVWVCKHGVGYPDLCEQCIKDGKK